MFLDAVKVGAQVAVFVRVRCVSGITQFVNEATHSVQGRLVEGFKDIESGEQKGARATGGVEDCHRFDGFPEGAKQVGTFAVLYDVLSKLADVQVIGDEVIHFVNFAVGQFGTYFLQSFPPCDNLAQISVGRAYSEGARVFHPVRAETSSIPATISGGRSCSTPCLAAS